MSVRSCAIAAQGRSPCAVLGGMQPREGDGAAAGHCRPSPSGCGRGERGRPGPVQGGLQRAESGTGLRAGPG